MLYIRTDANRRIGMGNMMRCLAIAGELRRQGEDSVFLVSENEAGLMAEKRGFRAARLRAPWYDYEAGLPGCLDFLRGERAEKLLVDSFSMTPRFSETMGSLLPLIYLGSREVFFPGVRLLVNYSNALSAAFYENAYDRRKTELLLGARYAPLREEFGGVAPVIREKVENILIAAGGSDENNETLKLARELSAAFPSLHFILVSGELNGWKESLRRLADASGGKITVLSCPEHMAAVMRSCDAAVTAAGTTLYELCACGTPAVCFSLTGEQQKSGKRFAEDGIASYAGDISENYVACVLQIIKDLAALCDNQSLRKRQSERMYATVDGGGCARIARAIKSCGASFHDPEERPI